MSVFKRDTFLGWLLSWFGILEDWEQKTTENHHF
jgi:hypothetical protein